MMFENGGFWSPAAFRNRKLRDRAPLSRLRPPKLQNLGLGGAHELSIKKGSEIIEVVVGDEVGRPALFEVDPGYETGGDARVLLL
jgi:hypothetical protein